MNQIIVHKNLVYIFNPLVSGNMSLQTGLIWAIVIILGLLTLSAVFMLIPQAYKRLDKLVLLFIALAPFHTIIRSISVDSVLLSGWRDILFAGIVALWLLGIIKGRFPLRANPLVLTVFLLNIMGVVLILRADLLLVGLAGYRDIIKYSLLAVVTYSLCHEQPLFLRRIVVTIFIVGVVVVALQFVFYFLGLDYVLRLGTMAPPYRNIGPFYLRRMEAFFGGGPSALGLYLGMPLVIYLELQQLGQKVHKWWHLGALLLLLGVIMTFSFSAVLVVGLVYSVLLFRRGGDIVYKLAVLAVLLVVFLGLNAGFSGAVIGDQVATNFSSYLINIFGKALFFGNLSILLNDPTTFIVGRGFALVGAKFFLNTTNQAGVMIIGNSDGGWVELAIQVGAPLVLLLLLAIVRTFLRAFSQSRKLPTSLRVTTWALLAALVVMFSSIHQIPWIRVGPDVNFWIVIGALASVPIIAHRHGTGQILGGSTRLAGQATQATEAISVRQSMDS